MGGNQMPPAGGFVLPADQVKSGGIVEAGCGKVIAVHGDTVQLGDGVAGVLIGVTDEVAGQLEHGAVKGEIGVEGGTLAQSLEALRNPV